MSNDSFGIDKMMELGMGIAIAKQMADTTTEMLRNVAPIVPNPSEYNQTNSINSLNLYIEIEGKSAGPFTENEALFCCRDGRLTPKTLIWMPGKVSWVRADTVPEINRLFSLTPPPLPGVSNAL